ncbi:Bromodomain adjacent to zinc finger domain protein 2B-like protein [Drosera capensis]
MAPDSSTETLTLDPNPSPTKRPQTDPHLTIEFRFDDDDITLPRCCGICLSEGRNHDQGPHRLLRPFLLFPLVRRDGSEIGEVVVPIQDQISNPDIDREESDPHTHVHCTVCHDSKDESLLLLCDLCDTAAHTYCVGLGVTVPDWFCEHCVTVRAKLSKHETRADISLPTTPCPTKEVPPAKVHLFLIS